MCGRLTRKNFDQNSDFFASCVCVILRSPVLRGVCTSSCRIQVGDSPANARVYRTKTFSLVVLHIYYTKKYTPALRSKILSKLISASRAEDFVETHLGKPCVIHTYIYIYI